MKWYSGILLFVMTAWMLASCGSRADRPSLVAADSLILHDPDSACAVLEAYPADSLTADGDRAYHALLTTIARYKAYRPATTDSLINIAVGHYDRSGADPDRRMRSLLYKGCVMEELGDPQAAMHYYKQAQYACPDDDSSSMGYIHCRIGALFQNKFKFQNAIDHFKKAAKYLQEAKDTLYYKSSIKNTGVLYCPINQDSANYYAQQCIELATKTNDESLRLFGYAIKAGLYFYNKEWENSKEWSKKVIDAPREIHRDIAPSCYYLCTSYIKLGYLDSAQIIMDMIPSPVTSSDSLSYYQCLSNLANAKHSYDDYIEYQKIPDNINTSIDSKLQDNTLVAIEKNIDLKHIEQDYQRVMFRYIMCFLSVLFLVIGAGAFVRRKHNHALRVYEKQLCIARDNTAQLIGQLESIVKEKDNALSQMQTEKDKALSQMQTEKDNALSQMQTEKDNALSQMQMEKDNALSQMQMEKDKADSESLEIRKRMIESIEGSLSCYSSILTNVLKQIKASGNEKNSKLASIMNEEFFAQLRVYLNLRYDNLIEKLANGGYNLSKEEINIICLDLCQFPNTIIWYYSNCGRSHSVLTKKRIIARKVFESSSNIKDIPMLIQNQSPF